MVRGDKVGNKIYGKSSSVYPQNSAVLVRGAMKTSLNSKTWAKILAKKKHLD